MSNIHKHEVELISSKIYIMRNEKVMLDSDLATLFGVPLKRLNEQVKRNIKRFPNDFMFQLTKDEFTNLKSQFATSSWGGKRKLPFVFTEHGAVMLASVLNSDIAISSSILVVRAFVKLREIILGNKELAQKIKELEKLTDKKFEDQNEKIKMIFEAIRQLIKQKNEPRNPVGFKIKK